MEECCIHECLLTTSTFAAVVGSLAAIFAAICAFCSFRLSQKIRSELNSDEVIIAGPLQKPHLRQPDHSQCVVFCTLFNKSRRKAYVTDVNATDEKNERIPITWSSSIDHLGNPQVPSRLLGLIDSVNLYVRRNDGEEIDYISLEISHSFPGSPEIVTYIPDADWR